MVRALDASQWRVAPFYAGCVNSGKQGSVPTNPMETRSGDGGALAGEYACLALHVSVSVASELDSLPQSDHIGPRDLTGQSNYAACATGSSTRPTLGVSALTKWQS